MAEAAPHGEGQRFVRLNVSGGGEASVDTGLPVLDHLVGVLVRYALFDVVLEVAPDSAEAQVVAASRALGQALRDPLRAEWARGHGHGAVPADEALTSIALDLAERPLVVSNVDLSSVHVGGLETDVVTTFLEEVATAAGVVIHVRLAHGDEPRHVLDSIFKALGVALGEACRS
jgi:imidazoleglycerol-phosphate dehydratase